MYGMWWVSLVQLTIAADRIEDARSSAANQQQTANRPMRRMT